MGEGVGIQTCFSKLSVLDERFQIQRPNSKVLFVKYMKLLKSTLIKKNCKTSIKIVEYFEKEKKWHLIVKSPLLSI